MVQLWNAYDAMNAAFYDVYEWKKYHTYIYLSWLAKIRVW